MEAPRHDQVGVPRCARCYYCLFGLPSPGRCPECARAYDFNDPSSYTWKPPFIGWVFWLPGLLLGVAISLLVIAFGAFVAGAWGWSLWIGAPMVGAAVLGYRVRVGMMILWVLCIAAMLGIFIGVATMGLAGVFCGVILSVVLVGPTFAGAGLGVALRTILKNSGFSQRSYLPVVGIVGVGLCCTLLDRATTPRPSIESVATTAMISAPRQACWDGIVSYEEVRHRPPLLLRIGLAHPLYTLGSSRSVGDVKVCVYNKGRITKRTTSVDAPERLEFSVIEQRIGYEREVLLQGGSFCFDDCGPDATQVTLTTTYQPLLTPRWCWRWGERIAVHTLHRHVLEGIRRNATGVDHVRAEEADAASPPLATGSLP